MSRTRARSRSWRGASPPVLTSPPTPPWPPRPRPAEVRALAGHPGLLRIRVGNHRIVYTVREQELIVPVVHLGHRSDVCDTL
ncbi:type II toxin-antitoxin system RelE family toxin [Micromonospora matsumotoense]|uniref:type II toxin-antitoxin system RelE family toxin n=1 Tax=Micromonospora matsumotoense TaxID=121616 RepID=UPI003D944C1F